MDVLMLFSREQYGRPVVKLILCSLSLINNKCMNRNRFTNLALVAIWRKY